MAQLIVPSVARYVVHQDIHNRTVVNILDMHIDSDPFQDARGTAVAEQGKIIARQWKADILPVQSNNLTLRKVSWIDLDSLNGVTGEFAGNAEDTLPATGGLAGPPLAPSLSMLVAKETNAGRGFKDGRMYLCTGTESNNIDTDTRRWATVFLDTVRARLDTFLGNINQESGVTGVQYDSDLCVVHQRAGGPTSWTAVTKLSPDDVLATQRRRLRS